MSYELTGTVKVIMDTQTFDSGFQKREFVVTTDDDKYPQDIKMAFLKDKVEKLDGVSVGQRVEVKFDLRGNEYNDRYYVDLTAWHISAEQDPVAQVKDVMGGTEVPGDNVDPSPF